MKPLKYISRLLVELATMLDDRTVPRAFVRRALVTRERQVACDDPGIRLEFDTALMKVLKAKQRDLAGIVARRTASVVQAGPFAGMKYIDAAPWGDLAAKLVGLYEQELHDLLGRLSALPYRQIVNVGCAEGYYAVGLALMFPEAVVHAFDQDSEARALCHKMAELNGVEGRVHVGGQATMATLGQFPRDCGKTLLVLDCEGCEGELLNTRLSPSLIACDIIVECHDFAVAGVTERILEGFSASHDIEHINEGGRDPNESPILRTLGQMEKAAALCEFRVEPGRWLFMRSKSLNAHSASHV